MATLEEILQLDKIQSSIKKIDLFVSQKTKYSKEYMKAIAYKGLVLHELGKTNEALKLLFEYVPEIKIMDAESVISLCSSIIEITISTGVYDHAAKYIRIKQAYLPISRQSEYIKDTTRLYLSKKDYENAKSALLKYLDDDISPDEEIYALEQLSMIYYQERSYDKYLECIPKLESHYTSILDISKQEIIAKNRIEIAFIKKNYIQVIMEGQRFFSEYDSTKENHLYVATYMMRSYMAVSDYKKAAIIESNYEDYISEDAMEASLEFCNAAIDLYNKTNSANSVIQYRRRIEELEAIRKEEATVEKPEKKSRTKKKEIIVPQMESDVPLVSPRISEDGYFSPITVLNPKEEEVAVQKQKVVEDIHTVKSIQVSENYSKLSAIFHAVNTVEHQVKFREIFRNTAIELTKQYPIEEIYILYFNGIYKGLHYKVERVYDKKPDIGLLEGTLGYEAMKIDQEIFLDQSDKTFSKNIVNGEDYPDDIFAFALPLEDSISAMGSITFISHMGFLAMDLCYESLKLISSALNAKLLDCIERENDELNVMKMSFIQENMSSGIKENRDGYLKFSKVAQDMLGVLETLTERDYLLRMNAQDAARYKATMEELFTLQTKNLVLEYDVKKDKEILHIKERFYPLFTDNRIVIYSLLDDLSREKKEKDDLVSLAFHNPISHMDTLVKLTSDLSLEYEKKKMSLAIIDVRDSSLYKELYGLNFYNQVIRAVGEKLAKAFEAMFTTELYHLEGTTYAVLFKDMNDKRIVDSMLKDALRESAIEMFQLNHRVKITYNVGVYRLGKNTALKDISHMISYASDALIDASAMDGKEDHISHYDSKNAELRFRDNSIITEISEAIDFGKIVLLYKQIVDLEKSSVLGFTLSLNMESFEIDEETMLQVVKRKGMLEQMEKYVLSTAFKELKMFYGELKGYLNLFIPVSKVTLQERFLEFLSNQQSFYKINPGYITLIAESIHDTPLASAREMGYHLASKDIFDVYRGLCEYFIYDYHTVSKESIPEILELCHKHNVICILSEMNTESDISLARECGYRFVFGDYYKNKKRMKDILSKQKKNK